MTIYLRNNNQYKTYNYTNILVFENNGEFVLSFISKQTPDMKIADSIVNVPIKQVVRIDKD